MKIKELIAKLNKFGQELYVKIWDYIPLGGEYLHDIDRIYLERIIVQEQQKKTTETQVVIIR